MTSTTDTYAFQAEINQLLSLIINTFYSNKDIFLRELISNASDAIDKIRFESLKDISKRRDYEIKLIPNKEDQTLTIEDNGIGLTKKDMIECLGTIANSGTKQFIESIKDQKEIEMENNMIGQFGVGFYSSYLVSTNVKVYSKHFEEDGVCYLWESTAGGTFTISEVERDMGYGTQIVLHMKDDCTRYLEEDTIKDVVKKHSEYITYPIKLLTTRQEEDESEEENDDKDMENKEENKEQEENDDKEENKEQEENDDKEENKEQEENDDKDMENKEQEENDDKDMENKEQGKKIREISEWKQLNNEKPLWLRKSDEITHEEHASFYKNLTNDWDDHLMVKQVIGEGQIEYRALLYVPKKLPFDLFGKKQNDKKNIKLYVKRVLIMDKCEDIIPEWLSFVSGVVDSEDLPLNVSREMLQENKVTKVIKKNLLKKCIEMFTDMHEDTSDEGKKRYYEFYNAFQKSIKLGIHEDSVNRKKLLKLLRFESNKSSTSMSLDQYVSNMKEDQTKLYYITGDNRKALDNSPYVTGLKSKGFDVIYMLDPIDEYIMQTVKEFEEKEFVDISKNDFKLNDEDDEKDKDLHKQMEECLCVEVKKVVGDKVDKVTLSDRLDMNVPCCISSSKYGWSANMEKIMKAQTLQATAPINYGSRNLELNPKNDMILQLHQKISKKEPEQSLKDIIELMYNTSLIACGYVHDDPSDFAKQIYKMIGIGIDVNVSKSDDDFVDTTGEVDKEESDTLSELD